MTKISTSTSNAENLITLSEFFVNTIKVLYIPPHPDTIHTQSIHLYHHGATTISETRFPKMDEFVKNFQMGGGVICLPKIYIANFPLYWGYIWAWESGASLTEMCAGWNKAKYVWAPACWDWSTSGSCTRGNSCRWCSSWGRGRYQEEGVSRCWRHTNGNQPKSSRGCSDMSKGLQPPNEPPTKDRCSLQALPEPLKSSSKDFWILPKSPKSTSENRLQCCCLGR